MNDTLQAMEQAKLARAEMLSAYRAKTYHRMTLKKSGLEIWVREASVTDLMLLGKLPESLLSAILEEADGKKGEDLDLNTFAGSADFGTLVNALVLCCAVEPPIAEVGDEQHLGLDEVPADDRMEIFAWANREVAANADKFRVAEEQPAPVA